MKNEYPVTWRLYQLWTLESMGKGVQLVFSIIWYVMGLVAIGVVASGVFSVLFIFLALFCFYRAFFRYFLKARKRYKAQAKKFGTKNWLRTITFEEDRLTVSEGAVTTEYLYADLTGIQEKKDKIWLTYKNKTVLRLYQGAFVGTDWAACKAKIEAAQ